MHGRTKWPAARTVPGASVGDGVGITFYAQWSKRPDGAYDRPPQGCLPAAVRVQPEPGKFPVTVFCVISEYAPRGVP